MIAGFHRTALRRARHDDPVALQNESAIDRQPEITFRRRAADLLQPADDLLANVCQTFTGHGGERDHRRILERRAESEDPDLFFDVANARGRHEIGFRHDEDRLFNAEEVHDVEMLLGLRHDAVVRGDGEEYEVDAVRPGEHVADETLVSGDVDDSRLRAVGEVEMGEAQIDRYAALFFFLQPVGVLARQRLDQARLAVVDMAGGADDVRSEEHTSELQSPYVISY